MGEETAAMSNEQRAKSKEQRVIGNCIPRWRGWREAPGVDQLHEPIPTLYNFNF